MLANYLLFRSLFSLTSLDQGHILVFEKRVFILSTRYRLAVIPNLDIFYLI